MEDEEKVQAAPLSIQIKYKRIKLNPAVKKTKNIISFIHVHISITVHVWKPGSFIIIANFTWDKKIIKMTFKK